MKISDVPSKARRVLHITSLCLLAILLRVWYLSVIQREEKIVESQKPQRRMVVQKANRGTISDRFAIPLALNRIRYNASIYYNEICQVPSIVWKKNAHGVKERYFARREYIERLAQKLGKALQLDPIRIEDLISAKASLLPHTPYVIKENLSEKEYYQLRMMERDWLGLHAEIVPERFYPQGKTAADIIGYMGAINQREYLSIARQIRELEKFIQQEERAEIPDLPEGFSTVEEVTDRLQELKERAYTVNDLIGKMGIEGKYEKLLRGFYGKKTYEIDVRGNFLKELDDKKPATPGNRLTLSISSELQTFAEELLAKNEAIRDGRSRRYDSAKKKSIIQKQPWIKGGAIVAIEPNTGEVLAMATYPRYDPNDFIFSSNPELKAQKQVQLHKWLETRLHIANLWDGNEKLTRERYSSSKKNFYTESIALDWQTYLDFILENESPIRVAIDRIYDIQRAIQLQEDVEALLYFCGSTHAPYIFDILFSENEGHTSFCKKFTNSEKERINKMMQKNLDEILLLKRKISPNFEGISHNGDKLFVVDLCRIIVNSPAFSDALIEKIGSKTLTTYWKLTRFGLALLREVRSMAKNIFHDLHFSQWREKNQKEFLQKKRELEKARHTYARPYIDYLDRKEAELFQEFWNENQMQFITSLLLNETSAYSEELTPYIEFFRQWHQELLQGAHSTVTWRESFDVLRELCEPLGWEMTCDFFRTIRSFSHLIRPLLCDYPLLYKKGQCEKDLAAAFYPRRGFGNGRSAAFRQSAPLGSIFKVVTAYEALKQRYELLKSPNPSFQSLNPLSINDVVRYDPKISKGGGLVVGYSLEGKPYPRFYRGGRLPRSHHTEIGTVDFLTAMEQSSNPYFALLAGDCLDDPMDLVAAAKELSLGSKTGIDLFGEYGGNLPKDLDRNRTSLYSFAIGQGSLTATPLQAALMLSAIANGGFVYQPQLLRALGSDENILLPPLRHQMSMPMAVRQMILEGLDRVVSGSKGNARPAVIKSFYGNPVLLKEYKNLLHQMVGKTSTAEIMYNPNYNPSSRAEMYKHIWFGSIAFEKAMHPLSNPWNNPELVVVVYLRFGDGGKEAAPLAAQIVTKWREIKKKYQ